MHLADHRRRLSPRRARVVAACAVGLSLTLLAACSRAPASAAAPKATVHRVQIASPMAGAAVELVTVGSVASDHRVQVSSRVASYVREVLVREGDAVRHGQLLARLDGADVDGAVRQSEAGLAAAQAQLRDAKDDLERFERLHASGTASDNDLRKVRLRHDAAREQANQVRATLDTARAQRAYVEIRSPVDGTVVARLKQPGDLAAPGLPLLVVDAGGALVFETHVADEIVGQVAKGQTVEVRLATRPAPLAGTVAAVVPAADPVTRSHLVRIALAHPEGVNPGSFGRAAFAIGKSQTPVVPRSALVERGGLTGVFVADEKRQVRFRWLRIGREWPDRVEVVAGLGAQERFVATPDASLHEGDTVEPAERSQ
jgi:RND family efflux transporter MFP subunit